MKPTTSIAPLRRFQPLLQHPPATWRRPAPPPTRAVCAAPRVSPLRLQKRHAQVHDVRFFVTHHDPSARIAERYKHKLDRKAKEEGHDSIAALKDAYKHRIDDLRRKALSPAELLEKARAGGAAAATSDTPPATPTPTPTPQSARTDSGAADPATGIRPLSSYLDREKVRGLPAKEIEALWRLRHASIPSSLCAAIPLDTYLRMAGTAKLNP
ncbi:hypothetical protein KEM52_004619, partial [Ascosphaera acerosa]